MRMKAQLENLFCRPKVWLQFWKLGRSLGGRKQWTFLFIERWKNKYAKKCLFLTGSKTPSYFCLFSLRAWEHSTNVNRRCFIVPRVLSEVSDHGQQGLAHLPAMRLSMRPLSAHVLWPQAGMEAGCSPSLSGVWGRGLGTGWEEKGAWSFILERPLCKMADRGFALWLWKGDAVSPDWERTSISLFLLFSHFSCVRLSVTPWTAARQAPLSMGFLGQEYWRGLPFPPPGDLPDLGNEPSSPVLAGGFFTTEPPGKPQYLLVTRNFISLLLLTSWANKISKCYVYVCLYMQTHKYNAVDNNYIHTLCNTMHNAICVCG